LHEEYPELVNAWNAFRNLRANRRAVRWLADAELIDDGEADRYLAEHTDPELP
jgi:hypothetical protein